MIKKILLALIALNFTQGLYASGILFGDLVVSLNPGAGNEALNVSQDVFNKVNLLDADGVINLIFIDNFNEGIKTILDAAQVCEARGGDLLIYGQVSQNESSIDVELKLYDHSKRKIIKTLYSRGPREDYTDLVEETGNKVMGYFKKSLLVPSEKEQTSLREKNGYIMSHNVGYWLPLGRWSELWTPLGTYGYSMDFLSAQPLWSRLEWGLYPRLGAESALRAALNQSGQAPSQYYSLDLGVMLSLALTYQRWQELSLGVGPVFRVGALFHKPLYDEFRGDAVSWWGAALRLQYGWWLDEKRSLGIGLGTEMEIYAVEPLYMDVRPFFQFILRGDL